METPFNSSAQNFHSRSRHRGDFDVLISLVGRSGVSLQQSFAPDSTWLGMPFLTNIAHHVKSLDTLKRFLERELHAELDDRTRYFRTYELPPQCRRIEDIRLSYVFIKWPEGRLPQLITDRNLHRTCELVKSMRLVDICIMLDVEEPKSLGREPSVYPDNMFAPDSDHAPNSPMGDCDVQHPAVGYPKAYVLNRTVLR